MALERGEKPPGASPLPRLFRVGMRPPLGRLGDRPVGESGSATGYGTGPDRSGKAANEFPRRERFISRSDRPKLQFRRGRKSPASSQQRRCQSFPLGACYGGQRCSVTGPIPSAAVPLGEREANAHKSLRFALPVPRRLGREASELIEDSHHGSASAPDEALKEQEH